MQSDERANKVKFECINHLADSPPALVELDVLSHEADEPVAAVTDFVKSEHEITVGTAPDVSLNSVFNSAATSNQTLDNRLANSVKAVGSNFQRQSSFLRSSFFRRKNKHANVKNPEEVLRPFLRADSVIYRVQPGAHFTEFATVVVLPPSKCDPKLGTLGELRRMASTGMKNQMKKFIRHNHWPAGHIIRAELWRELCRDFPAVEAQIGSYLEFLVKLDINSQTNETYVPVMLSSSYAIINNFMLTPEGVKCLLRLLTSIEHLKPDFSFIPKSAYTFLRRIMLAQDDRKLVPIFDDWMAWIFVGLPFTHLVRIVDCFIYEGQKVFYRIIIALVEMWHKEKRFDAKHSKEPTCADVASSILDYSKSTALTPAKLLKMAFSVRNLKMSHIRRLQEKHELNMRRGDSNLAQVLSSHNLKSLLAPHHYLDSTLPSEILTKQQGSEIIKDIPARFQLNLFSCLFATNLDGTSFNRLWSKIDDYEPTIFVIRTSRGEVFGAYCSESWSNRRKTSKLCNFGTGESFLFSFAPISRVYHWVGISKSSVEHKEELFQTADATSLIIGGSAISIRNSLENGSSAFSYTFDSPCLSCGVDFDIELLEVFSILKDSA